jgi:hypothetical protein
MTHPEERDLINYARDELGRYKKFRIIEHCKECPQCADRLIEAARDHGPDPEPFRLSKWNKISIVVMAIALIAVAFGMWWLLRSVGQSTPGLYEPPAAEDAPAPETPMEGGPPIDEDEQRLG